jgi:hypothetical protein
VPLEADSSLVARIGEWFWAVVWNWKGLVAGLSLASGFFTQLLPESTRKWLDAKLSPERRRRLLILLSVVFLFISCFEVYDNVSRELRHVSSELPDFENVATWSVSFEAVALLSASSPSDGTLPFYLALHRCRFTNLSVSQKRILDLELRIPTSDPTREVLLLKTENMPFQEYRKLLTDKGIQVDEGALGRSQSLLKTPIYLEPGQLIEGTVEFDIHDDYVKQKMRDASFSWLRLEDATVSLTDQRTGMTKSIKLNHAYNAVNGSTKKVGEHR